MQKITYCIIDETQLPLLFTLGAEMQIAERLGSTDMLFDLFRGEESEAEREVRLEIEKDMKPEEIEARDKREAEKQDRQKGLMDVLPFVISTLARQGQLYLGDPPTITEEWINLHARPADIEPMTLAMCKALSAGLDTRHKTEKDDVDLVAEAIEKN